MSHPITVLIPCKNEVDNIEACIASARRIATEVLVADSGSTDGTLQIAHRLADRVIQREYIDSGDFKNWSIPQAKHDWVLILDADERVTPELAAEIQAALTVNQTLIAFSVPRRNFFLGHAIHHGDWSRDRVTRLILRDQCRYQLSTDHAEIDVATKQLGILREKLNHYTAWDLDAYLTKMTHYAGQQAILWHTQGKRLRVYHVVLNAPLRFARGYILRLGFLDGMIGFQIASLTAYYSFLKQFLFWQIGSGRTLESVDSSYAADRLSDSEAIADSARPGISEAA